MIDFQARIDQALAPVVQYIASEATNDPSYKTLVLQVNGLIRVWAYPISNNALEHYFAFNLANRTIDAALLEQLHNEVTEWFTAIKEGAKA